MVVRRITYPVLSLVLPSIWLIAHGVSFESSAKSVLVVAMQAIIGVSAMLWFLKSTGSPRSELFLVGASLGFALTASADIALISSGLAGLTLAMVVVVALLSITLTRKSWAEILDRPPNLDAPISWFGISLILGKGVLTAGWLVALGILVTGFVVLRLNSRVSAQIRTLGASFAFVMSCLAIWLWHPPVAYGSWFLQPLYTGTDDNVFAESLSHSLSNFGLGDFAASSGVTNRYHFFSLAWSGMTSRIGDLEPFVMTLHVVPTVAFGLTAGLVWALTAMLTKSRRTPALAVIVLFASNSLPEQFRFFHTNTTSNTLTHVWLIAAFIIAVRLLENHNSLLWLPLTIFSTSAILAKAPYGVVLLSGLAILFLAVLATKPVQATRLALSLLPPLILPFIAALVFLRPVEWSQRQYSLHFNGMRLAVGVSSQQVVVLGVLMLILFARVAGIVWSRPHTGDPEGQRLAWIMLMGSTVSGLVSLVLDGNSAERYFLAAALVAAAPLTAIGIDRALDSLGKSHSPVLKPLNLVIGTAALGIVIHLSTELIFRIGLTSASMSLVPVATAAVSITMVIVFTRAKTRREKSSYIMASAIIAFAIGSTITYVRIGLEENPYSFTDTVADTRDIEALAWLHENSAKMDIVATNRYLCPESEACPFDDSSMLISALAQRRVFIEGPRFVVGGRPYPEWVTDRVQMSTGFASRPSNGTLNQLMAADVTWFYLDKTSPQVSVESVSAMRSLVPARFENDRVIIFKLTD